MQTNQSEETKVIKELSMIQFLGKRVTIESNDRCIANRNKKIIEFFSLPVSQVNRKHFKLQL